jgi:hypothetical protein
LRRLPRAGNKTAAGRKVLAAHVWERACKPADILKGLVQNLVFERHAFRIVFGEPPISGLRAGKDLEVILVADLLAGVDINPDRFHWITLYFLVRFRRGVGAGSDFPAFTALRTAISANINGPRSSTAAISISTARSHSGLSCSAFGSDYMYLPASRSVTSWPPSGKAIGMWKRSDQDTRNYRTKITHRTPST